MKTIVLYFCKTCGKVKKIDKWEFMTVKDYLRLQGQGYNWDASYDRECPECQGMKREVAK